MSLERSRHCPSINRKKMNNQELTEFIVQHETAYLAMDTAGFYLTSLPAKFHMNLFDLFVSGPNNEKYAGCSRKNHDFNKSLSLAEYEFDMENPFFHSFLVQPLR